MIAPTLAIALVAYLLGSLPMGYLVTRYTLGKDIRGLGSGRTGGTNVLRVAGPKLALITGVLDVGKAASAVWLARFLLPGNEGAAAAAGVAAVTGHIYSIFIGFKGGAGGAPTIGAALAVWPWSFLVVVPLGALVWYGIGYASVATLSFGLIVTAAFGYRWYALGGPWEHVVYGLSAIALCAWTLRPNIGRLIRGEERVVGWRARKQKAAPAAGSK